MRGLVVLLRWIAPLVLVLLVVAALLHGCRAAVHAAPADPSPSSISPDSYNFKLLPGQRPPAGATRLFADIYSMRVGSATDAEAALADKVEWWEPNGTASIPTPRREDYAGGLRALALPNDPLLGQQWALARMGAPAAWDVTRGAGVVIAVLDTGMDFSHPDLQGRFVSRGKDLVNGDDDASDDHGHGTHVAGIAAAVGNNGVGMAGVAYEARVLPVKVLAASGSGDHATIASGIAWAADQGAKVINLSLGGPYGSNTLEAAVDYAWGKGAVLTCAAGNDGRSNPSYPAAYANCLAVAATDSQDRLGSFSNFGSWVDVAAPGVQVLGTVRGGRYEAWNGTSMAAPNAAGVAALVWAAHPSWSNAQVRSAMESGAEALAGNPVRWGRLNAARAVGANPSPLPSPTAGRGSTPTVTPAPGGGDFADQVEQLINGARKANGLAPLRIDTRLGAAGDAHNRWMRDHNCFDHNCPGEPAVMTRMRDAGYPVLSGGENIGMGYRTPQDMLNGWMNSSGHRAAILNGYWPDLGCAYLAGGNWWSCEFARGDGGPSPQPSPTGRGSAPTATVRPGGAWPPGYFMVIEVPYDTSSQAQIDQLYRELCVGRAADGVRCAWRRYRTLEGP